MGSTSAPKHEAYEEMKDTPWITQGREIADKGGQGILDYYNKVNVFDDQTKRELAQRNREIYNRAFDNMERAYTNTMNKYNAANYNQFGTLNATPAAYRTDQYRRDFQRQMDDLAYNQAVNYDALMDNELSRRYNTLDMFGNLYNYGQIPYKQDVNNWNIENTNRNIAYNNALAHFSKGKKGKAIGGAIGGVLGTAVGTIFGGPLGGAVGSSLGQSAGSAIGGKI